MIQLIKPTIIKINTFVYIIPATVVVGTLSVPSATDTGHWAAS